MLYEITLEELKEKIKCKFDELQLLDFLGITIDELVEKLQDDILENYEDFLRELSDEEEDS